MKKDKHSSDDSNTDAVGGVRVQKILAACGFGSRREIEKRLLAGEIKINGRVAGPGDRIELTDQVTLAGHRISLKKGRVNDGRVIVYNKPEGELVTRKDPQGRPTVFRKLPQLSGSRWISVGRLDINSSGVLLLTTDGELANKLMHPSAELEREYLVRVLGKLSDEELARLVDEGVMLDDGPARFKLIEHTNGTGTNHWYRIVLMEGRNREIRRVFEALDKKVSRLNRIRYGNIVLGRRQSTGSYREIENDELNQLRLLAGLSPLPKPKPKSASRRKNVWRR